ncbi:lysozyme [Bosea sp. NBC_00550]|uniref:lysozyme n=1 Tax=Bosea sp. NBC_00550 TaxID=2969621 RepID=UPI00222F0501|nr:lysozyme [Bosea sp. NBC_00550]UZF95724.1 lysozyme [Bosea sp. NBC_00550]
MSAIGLEALIGRETRKLKAYLDSVGVYTIGIFHTAAAGAPIPYRVLTITREECDAIFARDTIQYEDAVRRALKVPVADHLFDELTSVCYNIGTGGPAGSSFIKLINAGASPAQIRAAILAWKKPSEILPRRTAEADQFQTPYEVRLPKARSTDSAPIKIAA